MADALNDLKVVFVKHFETMPTVEVVSPGRTEIAGTHTDHEGGHAIAAAVDRAVEGLAGPNGLQQIRLVSLGFGEVDVSLDDLAPKDDERATTAALVRGMAALFAERRYEPAGFDMVCKSAVLGGSGLSSSAAFELELGQAMNALWAGGALPADELAMMAQRCEREWFGKPCGLMDQAAVALGGIQHMDFSRPGVLAADALDFDFAEAGYAICIVAVGADHAANTADYAAVPAEMQAVAAELGATILSEVSETDVIAALPRIREKLGDRAALRALHYFREERLVAGRAEALRTGDIDRFLELTRLSGASSAMLLQKRERGRRLRPALHARHRAGRGAAGRRGRRARARWRLRRHHPSIRAAEAGEPVLRGHGRGLWQGCLRRVRRRPQGGAVLMAVGIDTAGAVARLAAYAVEHGICAKTDYAWACNRLMECVGLYGPAPAAAQLPDSYDFEADLATLADAGVAAGAAEDSATGRDRLSMRLMGAIMARPSEIAARFDELAATKGPKAATDWFYQLCVDVDYVRASAIAKNVAWTTPTRWGELEITINKSKPEKDPRDIAAAGATPASEAYPACQLCVENEGYSGRPAADAHGTHPARQNLRIIPIELGGERWGFQYSPYAYFEEHCIAMSAEHRPMHVDRASLGCLLDFVDLFPHYFVGSNADLPIVGGSILSHDHFQGGCHEFPMTRAQVVQSVNLTPFLGVEVGVLNWPLSVLRLSCDDRDVLLEAAVYVLDAWRGWSDPSVGIVAAGDDGTPHNTVSPICRKRGECYEFDLALRCNITTDEENIGLIEVQGLAILPPRLETELEAGRLTRDEIGQVFGGVLEDAGVFKWDEEGRAALNRFLETL